jgi:hypothetical protein
MRWVLVESAATRIWCSDFVVFDPRLTTTATEDAELLTLGLEAILPVRVFFLTADPAVRSLLLLKFEMLCQSHSYISQDLKVTMDKPQFPVHAAAQRKNPANSVSWRQIGI